MVAAAAHTAEGATRPADWKSVAAAVPGSFMPGQCAVKWNKLTKLQAK